MEAIKFSELPSGDRMPLTDEDGVPIIASQENRLLTWGRLKKQLAEQTHTDEVKPNDTKVPTSSAVEKRIVATEDDFNDKLTPITTKLSTHDTAIETATATANTAKTTAESASAVASEAKTTAEDAANSVGAVSQRVGAIETKIENGEFDAPEVDLSPITERLSVAESKNTTQDGRLDALEAKNAIYESAISETKTAASTAQTTAETAQTTATTAKNKAETLESTVANLAEQLAGLDPITLTEGIRFMNAAFNSDGSVNALSYSQFSESNPTTMTVPEAIKLLFAHQLKIMKIAYWLEATAKTREDDISAIVGSITNTLNSVVS